MTDIPYSDLDGADLQADAPAHAFSKLDGFETTTSQDACADHSLGERIVALVTGRCSKTGKLISEAGL
jgi:hypothetical protein